MKNRLASLLSASLLACALSSSAIAQITVTASADTVLLNHGETPNSATTNYSSAISLQSLVPANGDYQSYPLFKFDLSSYAGTTVSGDAIFSLHVLGGSGVNRPIQLLNLKGAVDFSTVTWDSYGTAFAVTPNVYAPTDSATYGAAIGGEQTFTPVAGAVSTFVIPASTVQSWIDSPSTNYGFAFFRSGLNYTEGLADFSSIEGVQGATLSFSSASAIPEPSTYAAMFGACALGFAAYRRHKKSKTDAAAATVMAA
ncbi:DNRLRE domain-containing protein [Oleiharenicola lentus]|uniref:DNRLRE domain-containing protein n=1 Tax=Oleiharenicola lentus TaxID=2508720 RepID=UPI003F663971